MPPSRGRRCRRCRVRIPRELRLCRVCGAINLKLVDYAALALLLAGVVYAAWRWA